MGVEIKQGQAFKIVELVYRKGVLDKASPLIGEAMKSAMEEAEFTVGDLVEVINESTDETVRMINKMLKYAGPVLSLMGNEKIMGPIMGLFSRMLDFSAFRTAVEWLTHKVVVVVFNFFKKINTKKLATLGVVK